MNQGGFQCGLQGEHANALPRTLEAPLMRLTIATLRRVVKGNLTIQFVPQALTSYGGLELLGRYLRLIDPGARCVRPSGTAQRLRQRADRDSAAGAVLCRGPTPPAPALPQRRSAGDASVAWPTAAWRSFPEATWRVPCLITMSGTARSPDSRVAVARAQVVPLAPGGASSSRRSSITGRLRTRHRAGARGSTFTTRRPPAAKSVLRSMLSVSAWTEAMSAAATGPCRLVSRAILNP
jgi:hypothetical protein